MKSLVKVAGVTTEIRTKDFWTSLFDENIGESTVMEVQSKTGYDTM
jgi:hypothetical protein